MYANRNILISNTQQFIHMPPWNILLCNTHYYFLFWKLELATVGK
jgi:hypothetical protein